MDYNIDREMLEWNEENYCLPVETNPVSTDKDSQQMNGTFLQVKRHRMLHFENEALDLPFYNAEMSSVFLKTKDRADLFKETLVDMTLWDSSFSDSPGYEGMDQSSKGWLDDCFDNCEMNNNPVDVNHALTSDVQMDISDYCNNPPQQQSSTSQKHPTPRQQKIVFKGTKSCTRTPTTMATSIAYPFDIIKPSGYHGDTTLQEINERIHSPLSSKLRKSNNPFAAYPVSAFSGKSVVDKTTIHTEGGRGSITIMKTKG